MGERVRVGVAGLRRGRGLAAVLAHHPAAELVAVADPDEATRAAAAAAYGVPLALPDFSDLLTADLDAVVIATPAPLHAAQAVAALDAGKHVLSEVPACWSVAEAQALVAAESRSAASYAFAENVNWFPRTLAWQAYLADGRLGELFYGEAEYVHHIPSLLRDAAGQPTWRATMPPIHYCTHSLGPLLAWTGTRCVTATALHTGSHTHRELGKLDAEVALFQTATGGVLKVLCAFGAPCEPGRHWYCLYGTGGMLESGRTADSPDRGYLAGQPATAGPVANLVPPLERVAPPEAQLGGHGDSEWLMVADWLTSLLQGTPPPLDLHAALDMSLPGLIAHQSALQGGGALPIPDSRTWSQP
ncbi:MAG: Gfo/Idh/MocA family oxidoreductase [Fimbriimonadaceae bacterium]|nr:Gfo/Idh/MocA family oxidoreductase [Fimbriimonadaceae bacterium]